MSKRELSLYIIDILIAINKIERYTKKFNNSKEFYYSELEWDATLRELQIIGDATNILLNHNLLDKSFRRIVDFRNQIVHAYFGVDEEIIWEVITKKLKLLYNGLIEIILLKNLTIKEALEAAIIENEYNENLVNFLYTLKEL